MTVLWIMAAFTVKHFICDFLLQTPYQYMNKGRFGHPGGLLHSTIHLAGSAAVLILFGIVHFGVLAVEWLIHYHIDWAKVNVNKHYRLRPDTSRVYWWVLGGDQFIHQMTYLGMIGWLLHVGMLIS